MVDPFAELAVALGQFRVACSEFLRQRGLTCQCRVALCPQRCDDGAEVGCGIVRWRGHPFPPAASAITAMMSCFSFGKSTGLVKYSSAPRDSAVVTVSASP